MYLGKVKPPEFLIGETPLSVSTLIVKGQTRPYKKGTDIKRLRSTEEML